MNDVGNISYTYAVSRIRVVEKKILDEAKLNRMIEAKSAEEALKVLYEAEYGYNTSEIENVFGYEDLLAEEQKKVYELMKTIVPKSLVFAPFLLMNDYHNIKVILKAEFLGQTDFDSLLIQSASIDLNKLKNMIKDRKMSDMPAIMKTATEECIDTFSRTGNPQFIDLILDKASYKQMKDMAVKLQNKFLNELTTILIDLTNIKIFLRIKKLKKSWDFMQRSILLDGSINSKVFIDSLEAPIESFVEALKFTPYGSLVEKGVERMNDTGSLTDLEKHFDNFVTAYLKKAKYISFGPEPLISYLLAKINEIKNVRIIMIGKLNNISNDIVRERLRDTYV